MADSSVADRVPETVNGQQGSYIALMYDEMQRHIRDSGWLQEKVDLIVAKGLDSGQALEIGVGPGYLGLEWLNHTAGFRRLTGVDLSAEMVERARGNCRGYGHDEVASFVVGDALNLPFADETFDCVFSYGSLHEWADPSPAFAELYRVLAPGGRFCVIDLRRDLERQALQFMRVNIAVELRRGFADSVRSSYLCDELVQMLAGTELAGSEVGRLRLGLYVAGRKPPHEGVIA